MTDYVLAGAPGEITRDRAHQVAGLRKGASEAEAYLCDNFLFAVLKSGMTTVEQEPAQARRAPLGARRAAALSVSNDEECKDAFESICGHRVLTYESRMLSAALQRQDLVLGEAPRRAAAQR